MFVARSGGRTKPEGEQRRPAHLERPLEAAHAEGVEHGGERDRAPSPSTRPAACTGRSGRTAPSPSRARCSVRAARGDEVEHRPQADEHGAGDDGRRARGSTKVRRAESNTSKSSPTPSTNHRIRVRTCIGVQLRRSTDRVRSVVVGGAPAALLALRLAPLGVEAGLLRRAGRLRRPPGRVDLQRVGQPRPEPFERELAVACLRPRVGRGGARHRTEALEQPRALARSERRRRRDREAHLDAGVGGVRVLTTGTARARRAPLELVEADHARRRDAQRRHAPRSVLARASVSATFGRVPASSFSDGPVRVTGRGGPGGPELVTRAGVHTALPHEGSRPPASRWRAPPRSWSASHRRPRRPSSPKPGGSVVYGLEAETGGGWCPPTARLAISGIEVGAAIYDTLMVPNTKNEMVPYLAKSVEPNADFTEWKITLRDGITFHDGTPLDADARGPELRRLPQEHADRRRARRTSPTSPPPARSRSRSPPAVPGPSSPGSSTSTAGSSSRRPPSSTSPDCASKLIGTGPFKLDHWTVNQELVVNKNPDYWQKDAKGTQLPYLDKITFKPVAEAVPARQLAAGRPARPHPHLRRPAGRRAAPARRRSSTCCEQPPGAARSATT